MTSNHTATVQSSRCATRTNPTAQLHDVSVQFPRSTEKTLTNLNFTISAHESVLLLGTSGSGKSTVLRALAGVVPNTIDAAVTGKLAVVGDNPAEEEHEYAAVVARAQHVAYLQQNPLDQLCMPTVGDEIAFSLENNQVPQSQMDQAIDTVLARLGVQHLTDRATGTLSGGEGQRVALASALVRQPQLLLLDEPTAMLDPAAARKIGHLLAQLRTTYDGDHSTIWHRGQDQPSPAASLLVEHRLDEIGPLPQTTIVLTPDGTVLTQGPTGRVLPESAYTLDEMGCWLPLHLRLAALHTRAGLEAPPNVETALRALATRTQSPQRDALKPKTTHSGVALEGRDLTARSPNGTTLLDDAHLTLHHGQITAIIGPNGSGKSTLLRTLSGLTDATGFLESNTVGLVFQHPENQFLTRSVRAEVQYGLREPHSSDAAQRVTRLLENFGLLAHSEQDPFRLSGGQQRRLSLATMAAGCDEVLLFDEPTFGQDRAHASVVSAQLSALATAGRAVVIVTHDLNLVAQIADQVLVMNCGKVVATGPTEQVLGDSRTLGQAGLTLPPLLRWCQDHNIAMRPMALELR